MNTMGHSNMSFRYRDVTFDTVTDTFYERAYTM